MYNTPSNLYLIIISILLLIPGIGITNNKLSFNYIDSLCNLPDSDSLPPILDESLEQAQKLNNKYILGRLNTRYGVYYMEETEEYRKSKSHFIKALEHYKTTDSCKRISSSYLKLSAASFFLGDLDSMLYYSIMSAEAASDCNYIQGILDAYHNIGSTYAEQGNYKLSFEYYNQCLSILDKYPEKLKDKASLLSCIGYLYYEMDSALHVTKKYHDSALELFLQLNDNEGILICYNNIANIFNKKQDYDSAIYFYQKAVDVCLEENFQYGLAVSLLNVGWAYRNQEKYQEALEYYFKSIDITEKYSMKDVSLESYMDIAKIYTQINDYENAYNYLLSAYQLNDSINNEASKKHFAELEAFYETKKKEEKIRALERKREKEKSFIIILASTSVLLLLSLLFFFIISKTKRNILVQKAISEEQSKRFKAVIEAQENERKHLAGELHDSVGPLLSLVQLYISDLIDSRHVTQPEEKDLLMKSNKVLTDASNETRSISHNLMPGVLIRLGLVSAIKELVGKVGATNKYKIQFNDNRIKERFTESIEINIYRVFQELLNNIIRHANATEISVELKCESDNLYLRVSDNGTGFDTEKIREAPGIGWKNIYSRLSLIGGRVDVNSNGGGTLINITNPVNCLKV